MKNKILKRLLIWLTVIYLTVIVGVYVLQKYIIFQGEKLETTYQFDFDKPFEENFIDTPDGKQLNTLLFKTELNRKGLVLYFHGNADNLQRWGKYHVDFNSRGYDVLMMDFRGFGKSTGIPNEALFYKDAKLIYDWVKKKYPDDELIIYGRSLGCGIASNLAAQVNAKMVFLETPFHSFGELIRGRSKLFFFPFNFRYDFPNYLHLQRITEPVIIFAGTEDWVVPNSSTEKLKPYLKPTDRYINIDSAGHKNLNAFKKYHEELDLILQ